MTPDTGAAVNKFDMRTLTNKLFNFPGLTSHGLDTLTSGTPDNLQCNNKYLYS